MGIRSITTFYVDEHANTFAPAHKPNVYSSKTTTRNKPGFYVEGANSVSIAKIGQATSNA